MHSPKVTIITVICGSNVDFMGKCLVSLIENTGYPNAEFVVVSDADDTMKKFISKVGEYNPVVKYVFREERHSNSSNRNLGAAHASADSKYLLFSDSDVLYSNRKWLDNLVAISEQHQDIGVIGGTDDDTSWGHCCFVHDGSGILVNVLLACQTIPTFPLELMVIPGCNMLIRNNVFKEVNGWDEGFSPVYGEDIDMCLRCILAGYRVFGMYNNGVKHIYRDTNENSSCELVGEEDYRWHLNLAAMKRLGMRYRGILPSTQLASHQEWIEYMGKMRREGRRHLQGLEVLPPTTIAGKLNPLYRVGNIHES